MRLFGIPKYLGNLFTAYPFNENSTVLYFDPLRNIKANTKPKVTPMLRVKTKFLVTGEPEN